MKRQKEEVRIKKEAAFCLVYSYFLIFNSSFPVEEHE